jgi:hypothetical protein
LRNAISYLESIGGLLICTLAGITPWLFGTTEDWSVRLMNIGCLVVGLIFAAVGILGRLRPSDEASCDFARSLRYFALSLFGVNLVFLGYCAVAYLNPRATFSFETQDFSYFEKYNPSLPTTYDRNLTSETLLNFFCLFIFFWAVRAWLAKGWINTLRRGRPNPNVYHNRRFRALLWVLSVNAITLALQATLQRLTHSEKLLWMRHSWWKSVDMCFGPFSYRGNAAEYFNLIWPLAFGFAILSFRNRRITNQKRLLDGPELLLIPGLILLGVAPFLSLSRGGAIIAGCGMVAFLLILILEYSHSSKMRILIVFAFVVLASAVWLSAARALVTRFQAQKGFSGREEIYVNAKKIVEDFPVFGTGPGTFRSVYHLYRPDISQEWHAFVHNDWLETRVTVGWVGFILVLLHLAILGTWILVGKNGAISNLFFGCIWISLVQTLIKAGFDFPFQTYSILFTFILVCAIGVSSAPAAQT